MQIRKFNPAIIVIREEEKTTRCRFCRKSEINDLEWGSLCELGDVAVHYFCIVRITQENWTAGTWGLNNVFVCMNSGYYVVHSSSHHLWLKMGRTKKGSWDFCRRISRVKWRGQKSWWEWITTSIKSNLHFFYFASLILSLCFDCLFVIRNVDTVNMPVRMWDVACRNAKRHFILPAAFRMEHYLNSWGILQPGVPNIGQRRQLKHWKF